ncbi:Protein trichome birefringence-like 11 [Camellia lanceoleosa]|uniref:Protein trichome birefringence-like 11 n=1 Tax=Camellia lanceoleosa TaxID=1840588 RepID=A0ACC0IBL8_9ERIC|nr:Protein trichome birefringence-like 11 [Camellia lanceoleosa]
MSKNPSHPDFETMSHFDFLNKFKRLRLFEPSLGFLGFFLLTLCFIYCFFYLDYRAVPKGLRISTQSDRFVWLRFNGSGSGEDPKIEFLSEIGSGCDVFEGDWAWDESYPLYQSRDCRFLDDGFRCSENGRPDLFYTKWCWQPKACDLPRFVLYLCFSIVCVFLDSSKISRPISVGSSSTTASNSFNSLILILTLILTLSPPLSPPCGCFDKDNGSLVSKVTSIDVSVNESQDSKDKVAVATGATKPANPS